jgi:hypothetical protein
MPTMNEYVVLCQCTHPQFHHVVTGREAPCKTCPCKNFRPAASQNLKESEQRRRLTED